MKVVDRRIVRERLRQLQFGQRFVFPEVDRFQAPPPWTEIEKPLLLGPVRVIEGQARGLAAGGDPVDGAIRRWRLLAPRNLPGGVLDPARIARADRELKAPLPSRCKSTRASLVWPGSANERRVKKHVLELDAAIERAMRQSGEGHLQVARAGKDGLAGLQAVLREHPVSARNSAGPSTRSRRRCRQGAARAADARTTIRAAMPTSRHGPQLIATTRPSRRLAAKASRNAFAAA